MSQIALSPSDAMAQRLNDLAGLSRRVAHDFDNILTGIIGFAELSLGQVDQSSVPHKYLTELLRVCDQGIQLTKRLHQFHDCGQGRPLTSDPAQVVAQEIDRLRAEWPATVRSEVQLAEPLPLVRIESDLARQVLSQLLTNACEACASGGLVRLRAFATVLKTPDVEHWMGAVKPGPHVEIQIADSGRGIPADVRARLIMEPFVTTKPKHRGLGLPMVFRILHAQTSGIRLETAPEGGCLVRIVLPAVATQEANT